MISVIRANLLMNWVIIEYLYNICMRLNWNVTLSSRLMFGPLLLHGPTATLPLQAANFSSQSWLGGSNVLIIGSLMKTTHHHRLGFVPPRWNISLIFLSRLLVCLHFPRGTSYYCVFIPLLNLLSSVASQQQPPHTLTCLLCGWFYCCEMTMQGFIQLFVV